MNSAYKLLCLAATFLVSSGGFADNLIANQSSQSQNNSTMMKKSSNAQPFEQGMALPANKYPAAYNAPAGISVKNGWDFDLFGSFIYWHASQDFMDIARVAPNVTNSAATSYGGTVAFQDVTYEPGFKVGFGFNTNYDGWVFRAEYTWLHQTVSTSALTAPALPSGAAGTWASSDWFVNANSGEAVSSSWKMNLDMVDALFERPFYQGTMLTVTPFGGMRGLWLRQNLNINLLNSSGVTTSSSNNHAASWAVGPATGVGGHWLLGYGFRFEGNAVASLLYTRYTTISHDEQDSQAFLVGANGVGTSVSNIGTVRPVGQLNVGLGWGSYCCNDEFYFDIALDYEFINFWEQNVMRSWVGQIQGRAEATGDLQMHGLTATLRFDF